MSDPWDEIRHATLDQIVTAVKLRGSASMLRGLTTPEVRVDREVRDE
jgi:hypothetical protein